MRLGANGFFYEEINPWGHLPAGMTFYEVPDVAVDSQDRLYVFARGAHPVIVLDREGHFLTSWGQGLFKRPHGAYVGPDDTLFCVDDEGNAVYQFTPDGKLLMAITAAQEPVLPALGPGDPAPIVRTGAPFNKPTGLGLAPSGDIYVSDGYGNARVHRFSADGQLQYSWGEPGTGPGQFVIPHDVCMGPDGLLYVPDRMNKRIQVFTTRGEFVRQWSDISWPNSLCLDGQGHWVVTELGGLFWDYPRFPLDQPLPRVTVRDLEGNVLVELTEQDPLGAGRYFCPHGAAVDSHGDIYIGEVSHAHTHQSAPEDWPVLTKYVRC
jgi:hypothetical protein